jgi:hypothetical protein
VSVNKTVKKGAKTHESSHSNFMGGRSWDLNDPVLRLEIAASSCFFGEPMYYHRDGAAEPHAHPRARGAPSVSTLHSDQVEHLRETLDAIDPRDWRGLSPAALMERAIDEALDKDPAATLEVAVRLRNQAHMRTTPQIIFVKAAHHRLVKGTGILRQYAERIMRRLDEPAVQLAYHIAKFGKDAPIPNALKKCWKAMLEGATEYGLAKYRQESREVKLVDIVNLCHPKSAVVDALVRGTLKTTSLTWESIVSAKGSSVEAWTEALGVMGHMALLRNLRNLHEKGVSPDLYIDKLVTTAEDGQQLPFRYWSAYQATKAAGASSRVLDAIERCLNTSVGSLPTFKGRVMSLCDNSGSAQGATTSSMGSVSVATIANLTGVLTGMRAEDGWLGVFGNKFETFQVRGASSVFDQVEKASGLARDIGQDTENGVWLFFDRAIKNKEHWDHIFIYSDMQAGHGGLYGTHDSAPGYRHYMWPGANTVPYIDVAKLVHAYRTKVNQKVNVYLVQVAGYQDVLVPEFYDRTYILGGWSENVIPFAVEMSRLRDGEQASPKGQGQV